MTLTTSRARKIRAGIILSIQESRNERVGPRKWDDRTLTGRAYHIHRVRSIANLARRIRENMMRNRKQSGRM